MKRYKVLFNSNILGINTFAGDIIEVYSSQKWKLERLRMSNSHFIGDIVKYYPSMLIDITHEDTRVSVIEYKIKQMWERQPYNKNKLKSVKEENPLPEENYLQYCAERDEYDRDTYDEDFNFLTR